jgi:3-hydroxybutyryl-CoA dehydrogenase
MKVAIFGAGTMGSGIAQVFAAKGHVAMMYASSVASAQRHRDKLAASLNKRVAKGKMTQEAADDLMSRVVVEEFDAAADADLVIECVAENMAVKKELLGRLDAICKESAIFASNTSSLSITEMANGLNHQLVGMHFFNPVPAMKLVEVIAGANTPDELVEFIKNLSIEIGKTPVVVNEAPGFVVNKILVPYCNEGVCVLQEGVASAEDIDIAMQLGANHPMGPLHLGDLIGWDVVLSIMDVLYHETGDSKYRANVLIRKMVRAGKLGIKSGEGFFNYKK